MWLPDLLLSSSSCMIATLVDTGSECLCYCLLNCGINVWWCFLLLYCNTRNATNFLSVSNWGAAAGAVDDSSKGD